MRCPTCKSPVPYTFTATMRCAMCVAFGPDRNSTVHLAHNITAIRANADRERKQRGAATVDTLLDVCFLLLTCLSPYIYPVSHLAVVTVLTCGVVWFAVRSAGWLTE
jgi:hypothetical protein